MITSTAKRTFLDRMLGAALLEVDTYEEAAANPAVRKHAAYVVAISSLGAAIGGLGGGFGGAVVMALAALAGFGLFAFGTFAVATRRFALPATGNNRSVMLRTLALASAPRALLALTIAPEVGFLIGLSVHAWVLITGAYGLRTALDMELRPAVASAGAGVLAMTLLWALAAVLV